MVGRRRKKQEKWVEERFTTVNLLWQGIYKSEIFLKGIVNSDSGLTVCPIF